MKLFSSSFILLLIFIVYFLLDVVVCQFTVDVERGQRNPSNSNTKTKTPLVQSRYKLKKKSSIALTSVENIYYYGDIGLGTPSKKFKVIFDTGSADLWVISSNCTTDSCKKHKRYNYNSSSSWSKSDKYFLIIYGDGSFVEGKTIFDTLTIGRSKIKNQGFAHCDYLYGMDNDLNDGILGLGYNSLASTGFATLLSKAHSQKKIPEKIVSFWLSQTVKGGGSVTFGGVDKTRYKGFLF